LQGTGDATFCLQARCIGEVFFIRSQECTIKGLEQYLTDLAKVKSGLDLKLLHFVRGLINEESRNRITEGLLMKGAVHPFSVQIASLYLLRRVLPAISSLGMPEALMHKMFRDSALSDEELLEDVKIDILGASESIFNGDTSILLGDPRLKALKINSYRHLHQGFKCLSDAFSALERDTLVIRPVLVAIQKEIILKFSGTKTIVIKDAAMLSDPARIAKAFESMQRINDVIADNKNATAP